MSQLVSVLDFGSGKISVFTGERGLNSTIKVKGIGVCEYPGFYNGELVNLDKLPEKISEAIHLSEESLGQKIESLYVGVPADFCVIENKTLTMNFKKRHKITDYDVQDLYLTSTDFSTSEKEYEMINVNPIYFSLDNERRIMDPENQFSTSLNALVSFLFAKRTFTDFMRTTLKSIGVKHVEFSSTMLSEILSLFQSETRDEGVVLIDSGYSSTNVAVAKGDGILYLKSFALGGVNITADISNYFDIPFKQAEKLKKSIDLSLDVNDSEDLNYTYKNKNYTVNYKTAIEIVKARIKSIGKGVEKCIALCPYHFPDYLPYHLTGAGLSYYRGVKEVLGNVLDKKIEIATPQSPLVERPNLSSAWSLMDTALNDGFDSKSVLSKFFKKG